MKQKKALLGWLLCLLRATPRTLGDLKLAKPQTKYRFISSDSTDSNRDEILLILSILKCKWLVKIRKMYSMISTIWCPVSGITR